MTRREKLRESTIAEIKTLARQQMADSGTAGVSLNGIARSMEMSTPALYRYFASRDDLITALIVDAFTDMAETLEDASRSASLLPVGRRLFTTLLAYREWALVHPVDFQLIYGNPIPGYSAPDQITTPAAYRTFRVFLEILFAAYQQGLLSPLPEYQAVSPGFHIALPPPEIAGVGTWPLPVMMVGMIGWTRMHGIITLELYHHTTPLLDDPGAFYRFEMENLVRQAGLSP